ncbi:MAG TPA: signal peptide peptidase SppA [Acidobacteriota bacterium]|jgi:protease-4
MKRRTAVILGIVLVVIITVLLGVLWMIRSFTKPPEVKANSVLVVELQGEITDGPVSNPIQDLFNEGRPNVYDLRRAVDQASQDKRIRGIILKLGPNNLGWASAQEIHDALAAFRKSGKPVYASVAVETLGEKDYFLALPASRILLNPDTALMLNGMYAEVAFFRKALDKLYIKPQFIQFKEYKSAAEPYMRREMSPQFRESLEYVVRDIENNFVRAAASARHKSEQEIRAFMESGLSTAAEAKQRGLIDDTGYWHELENQLKKEGGKSDKKDDSEELRTISVRSYLKAMGTDESGKSRVGLVFASGVITSGESDPWDEVIGGDTVAGYIRTLRKDKSIKAIILRVDSPGGSAVGSDVIWREVREARSAGKPVVVSMGDVAGSGGYYISMAADRIVAEPSTITGSIGVVFGKMDTRGFFDWLGVTFDEVKTGKNADIFSFTKSLSPEQEQQIREWMSHVYNDFVAKAAEGRRKPFETIEPVAHGRIWSGTQAKDRSLIDAIGGFNEALRQAQQLAHIPAGEKVRFVTYPKKKSLFELLFSGDSPLAQLRSKPSSVMDLPLIKSLQDARLWMITPDIRID